MSKVMRALCLLTLVAFVAAPMVTTAGQDAGTLAMSKTPEKPMKAEMAMPATDGKALWAYLTGGKYQEKFALWPGKGKLYQGKEPHGALLTTYVNAKALEAIDGKKGVMAPGSIVVKENYKPDKTLAATTVMFKADKYNPEANDWFWAKYAPDGSIQKEGKVGGCIGCHGQVKDNDYLFTGKLK
jgi:hypothetical protein